MPLTLANRADKCTDVAQVVQLTGKHAHLFQLDQPSTHPNKKMLLLQCSQKLNLLKMLLLNILSCALRKVSLFLAKSIWVLIIQTNCLQ